MAQCAHCQSPAKHVAVKRFSMFGIQPRYLCEHHKKKFERTEDLLLILALIVSVAFFVASLYHDVLQAKNANQQALLQQEQVYAERDLDHDGRVSLFEAQTDEQQMQNFRQVGYPFVRIILPGEPTKSVFKKIDTKTFANAVLNGQDGQQMAGLFHHPRLIKNFLVKYTNEQASPFLKAIFLTHDLNIAYVLGTQENGAGTMICVDPLDQELYDKVAALPAK
ncbi:MAG TPA: hypothetical protein PKW95_13505 [bacterium]|nr:hypothetical protein [bacterium]